MPDEARETLTGSGEPDQTGTGFIYNARAVTCLAEGDPASALDVLRDVPDVTPPTGPAFTLVEAHLLAGIAHLHLGDRNAAAAAGRAALASAEPDRLIFPLR
jgi:LuxR family maltose regulon positive regulatory protein